MLSTVKPATGSSKFTDSQPAPEAKGCVQLRASGLKLAFGGQVVLDGVDLELRQGEVVLLRGENGSGKTTLLNILTGNLEPDSGTIDYLADGTPRTFSFPRRWWQDLNPWDHFRPEFVAKEGIGRTWQDVRLFGAQSLRDNIAVAEPGHPGENPLIALIAPDRAKRREADLNHQTDAMLARLGLAGREESSADMISLGQSKRVAIARAVAAGAKILFLDEPLAGLDRQGVTDVLALLESLVREHDLTLVIVEHVFNQPHLHGLVTTDWLLQQGRIKKLEVGSNQPSSFIPNPLSFQTRPPWFDLLAGNAAEILDEPLPRGALLTRIRRPERWKADAKPILEIKNLIVKRGPRTIIGLDDHGNTTGFTFTLYEGEIAILQAPNGWGKSTLFAALCGQLASTGAIVLNGTAVDTLPAWERVQHGLTALPSNKSVFSSLTVNETALLSRSGSVPSAGDQQFLSRPISSLSGGEKQRTLIRLSLGQHDQATSLALYDEPFAMLDNAATRAAAEQMSAPREREAILLFTPAIHSN